MERGDWFSLAVSILLLTGLIAFGWEDAHSWVCSWRVWWVCF